MLALVLVAGCGSGTAFTPRSTQLATSPTGTFVLYVSDQSFETDHVDITIRIDGKVAVSDQFAVGNEHNWQQCRFQLPLGVHRLTAISQHGHARLASTFRMGRNLNGVVDYWYSPGNPGGQRKRTFSHTANQTAFA